MNNSITDIFDIDYPIVQGGMIWNAGWELASAVSEAGGLGLIGSGSMKPDTLREHIRKTRDNTSKPFGVNIPLIYEHAEGNVETVIEEDVEIVFSSAGSPKKTVPALKKEGIKVFHVVSNPELAKKCQKAGVDGVVGEGFEAGGHLGRDELTTMVLIPQIAAEIDIPVLAAGGIVSGAQIAAALALGAAGVQMGTRFALTKEGSGHEKFKEACLEGDFNDTQLLMKKLIPVRLLKNDFSQKILEAEKKGATREELSSLLGKGRAKRGMFEGNLKEGELEIGQGIGMIDSLMSVQEVIDKLIEEFNEAKQIKGL